MFKEIMKEMGFEDTTNVGELTKPPMKEKKSEIPHFERIQKQNAIHQADTMNLPNDDGYNYVLSVIDVGTRHCDAEPLKEHSASAIKAGLEAIYERNNVSFPTHMIQVDAGTEFKGEVKRYFEDEHVFVRVAKVGRHRQQGLVERMNYVIAKAVNTAMTQEELKTGETNTEWTKYITKIITVMNKRAKEEVKPTEEAPRIQSDKRVDLLAEGTKVRVVMEEPRETTTGKKLPRRAKSGFGVGDLRWEKEITEIKQIVLRPNQPAMYLTKYPQVPYTRKQLLVVKEADAPKEERKRYRTNHQPENYPNESTGCPNDIVKCSINNTIEGFLQKKKPDFQATNFVVSFRWRP